MSWLAAVPAPDPNAPALYAAVSAVLVALITAVSVVASSWQRRRAASPSPRREMAQMLLTTMDERDLWKDRALACGWVEP